MIRLLLLNSSKSYDSLKEIINPDYFDFEFNFLDSTYRLIPVSVSDDSLEISLTRDKHEISNISVYFIEQNENGKNLYDVYIDNQVEESVDYLMVDTLVSNWLYDFFHDIGFSEENEQESFDKGAYIFDAAKYIDKARTEIDNAPSKEDADDIVNHYLEEASRSSTVINYCEEMVLQNLEDYCKTRKPWVVNSRNTKLEREFSTDKIILKVSHGDEHQEVYDLPIRDFKILTPPPSFREMTSIPRPRLLDFDKGCIYLMLTSETYCYSKICSMYNGRYTALPSLELSLLV